MSIEEVLSNESQNLIGHVSNEAASQDVLQVHLHLVILHLEVGILDVQLLAATIPVLSEGTFENLTKLLCKDFNTFEGVKDFKSFPEDEECFSSEHESCNIHIEFARAYNLPIIRSLQPLQ